MYNKHATLNLSTYSDADDYLLDPAAIDALILAHTGRRVANAPRPDE